MLDDSLATYCVGDSEAVLFRITVRLVVDAAPLLILNDEVAG